MPSEKVLKQKQEVVAQLKNKLSSAVAGVVVDYKGITVAQDTSLRRDLRAANVEYAVVKNTLLKLAIKDEQYEDISSVLEGTTAIALSNEDPVVAAKILAKYADSSKGKFVIKAGFVEGKTLDSAGVNTLAKLPSKEQLIVQVLGMLQGNIRGLAVALNAIAEKAGQPE